jgi:hypothetical protein
VSQSPPVGTAVSIVAHVCVVRSQPRLGAQLVSFVLGSIVHVCPSDAPAVHTPFVHASGYAQSSRFLHGAPGPPNGMHVLVIELHVNVGPQLIS